MARIYSIGFETNSLTNGVEANSAVTVPVGTIVQLNQAVLPTINYAVFGTNQ